MYSKYLLVIMVMCSFSFPRSWNRKVFPPSLCFPPSLSLSLLVHEATLKNASNAGKENKVDAKTTKTATTGTTHDARRNTQD